jgi:methionyl-tRNA formyltransferase
MDRNSAEPIRIVYFGTPDYAAPALMALVDSPGVEVSLVVTQPDRPAGRGRKLSPPPVKEIALEHGIPVYQPETLRTETDRAPIASAGADLFVVAAFGKIFGPKLLALPRLGAVNLHASLLPLYRGASPISASIFDGRDITGVTLMQMDVGLDTGPVLAQRSIPIGPTATTKSLTAELANLGAELLVDNLYAMTANATSPIPQDDAEASLTRPMVKADGWIDWSRPAVEIERQIRAMWDWPRGWTTLRGEQVQVHQASVAPIPARSMPGTVEVNDGKPVVATGDGYLVLEIAQRAGSRPLPGSAWLQQADAVGEILGTTGAPEPPAVPLVRPVVG